MVTSFNLSRHIRFFCGLFSLATHMAFASDACSPIAVQTRADVRVSDGSEFVMETFYQSPDHAAIRQTENDVTTIAVEGPFAWASRDGRSEPGSEFHKLFALGHQFHALLLHFEGIIQNTSRTAELEFSGSSYPALTGDYPYGGRTHLVESDGQDLPLGLRFDFPEGLTIEAAFSDWREVGGTPLPFHISIDDDDRTFEYRFQLIDTEYRSPLWFFESLGPPPLDDVLIHRVHRKLLAAHCLGDANMMAQLTAPEIVVANRGALVHSTREATRARFRHTFTRFDYTEYHDLVPPEVVVAESGDIGWISVQVRAAGTTGETATPFDTEWAWIMLVRKLDGEWLHAGNASNRKE